MNKKICCIFNLAPHYRKAIYTKMDKELNCDFYFGDKVHSPIKQMDFTELIGFQKTLTNSKLGSTDYRWQRGAVALIFKPYKNYIITGEANYISSWVLLLLAKVLGKKTYAWSHGLKAGRSTKRTVFEKTFLKLFTCVFTYGNHAKNFMLSEGFKKHEVKTIYNSLDHNEQLIIRKQLKKNSIYSEHFKNDAPVLIYVGRIQKTKKLDSLVNAISQLNKKGHACNLVIIGANVDSEFIYGLIEKQNVSDKVWLYGPSYNEKELGNLIYNADVCVSPGPVGLTAIHAMTYGCPVITNDNFDLQMPEFEIIKEGVSGAFFKDGNENDMIAKIKQWTNLSPELRESTRVACFDVIDMKWNPGHQMKILKQVFN